MGLFVKVEELQTYIQALQFPCEQHAMFWATVIPSFLTSAIFGPDTTLATNYNVLQFNQNELIIIAIDNGSGNPANDHLIIPMDAMQSINFTKQLLGYHLEIKTAYGLLNYTIRTSVIGAKWHKANLQHVLARFNNI